MTTVASDILVIGNSGQVARCLSDLAGKRQLGVTCHGRPETDITEEKSLESVFVAGNPKLVINASAYTAVDNAETDKDTAFRVNAQGPANLAQLCKAAQIPLIHISTDYVFNGTKDAPYVESDPAEPLGVYGQSKLEGERAVQSILDQHLILRTAWVFSEYGHNFLKTMVRLGQEREELSVVNDQLGCPTDAMALADVILELSKKILSGQISNWGVYHACGAKQATWHKFATDIFATANEIGLQTPRAVHAITSDQYPTPVTRPPNSVLSCEKLRKDWDCTVAGYPDRLAEIIRSV